MDGRVRAAVRRAACVAGAAIAVGAAAAAPAAAGPAGDRPAAERGAAAHGGGPGGDRGHGRGSAQARQRAGAAVEAMMGFFDPATGRYQPERPWWQSGNALQALLDYVAKTGSNRWWWQIHTTIEIQRRTYMFGEFRADSTDDTAWWALAMTRMHDLTGDPRYLDIATLDEAYIRDYWDDVCGGGVWWDIPQRTYKNAISAELYLQLTAALHNRIPGDRLYLERALEAWRWIERSGMQNPSGLFNDGLNTQSGGCENNGGETWTYNQGVVLGGLAELYRATGDRRLLAKARRIADAVLASPRLVDARGILTEPCEDPANGYESGCNWDQPAFKGIFARNLAELDALLPGHPYRRWLQRQAASAYANARDAGDRYGNDWGGPFDGSDIARQESAVSLLVAVL